MKKFFKTLKLCCLSLFMTPLVTGCGFFNGDSDNLVGIAEITTTENEDGSLIVTITFTDDRKPVTFEVPKGKPGKDGTSIASIKVDSETNILTIKFTDPEMDDVVYQIPVGRSLDSISSSIDEGTGDTLLVLHYTDGTSNADNPIRILRGIQGIGIDSFTYTNNDDGSLDLLFIIGGEEYLLTVPAAKQGVGITNITGSVVGDEYVWTIYFTEGEPKTVSVPRSPIWTEVTSKPSDSTGIDGDFAYDTDHDIIYVKKDGYWVIATSLETDDTEYTVQFLLNAADAHRVSGAEQYSIRKGQTFYSSGKSLPVVTRSGYKFCGWCTNSDPNGDPSYGYFTDLTPVLSAMTLYAIWAAE